MFSAWALLVLNSLVLTLRLDHATPGSFPRPLKPEQERQYLEAMAGGDESARDKLVEHNLRLVAHIVKKYNAQPSDLDDLISIGTVGLIKGISSYDPGKKTKLATYASRCIENEILMYFRSRRKLQGEVSLSETLEMEGENSLSLMDVIRVDDTLLEDLDLRDSCQKVRAAVEKCLEGREKHIITLRYGLGGQLPLTQRQIAQQCGISRSYVSRIEKKALERLREELER